MTQREPHHKAAYKTLTDEDVDLVIECAYEKQRLRAEETQLTTRLAALRAEKKQLTAASLAVKFEVSQFQIQSILNSMTK